MDFVISDVTTVEQDDDEPLYEVKKIVDLISETKQKTFKEVKRSKYTKICYVPLCPNSSKSTPEKMFITVPVNPARRKLWLEVVGKSSSGRNPKSPMFCCQDHFNLKKDMKNYSDFIAKGKVQMQLRQTAVPHIFKCNSYGHLKRVDRIEVLRKLHENVIFNSDEEDCEEVTALRLTPRQRSLAIKRKKMEEEKIKKTVFIEMPHFQYQDGSHHEVEEDEIDTIVIDDSD